MTVNKKDSPINHDESELDSKKDDRKSTKNENEKYLMAICDVAPCESKLYGYGELLDMVQRSGIFKDSKVFVDLVRKWTEEDIVNRFLAMDLDERNDESCIKMFLDECFYGADDCMEFEAWVPGDWVQHPESFGLLASGPCLRMADSVNKCWKSLSRKVSGAVQLEPKPTSKICLPHGFIIPGGRFKEIYYWDSYWIMKGLLHCGMVETARGMMENLFYQVEMFGCIPNGTRDYYIRRSQPPYLMSMMEDFMENTNDWAYLAERITLLEQELMFWEEKRSLVYHWDGREYMVFRYGADCKGPRPESYIEDMEIAEHNFSTDEDREEFFLHIKAAAESGWDFSSRWTINADGEADPELKWAKTNYILPVDLNALMYKNYSMIAYFFRILQQQYGSKADEYEDKARKMMDSMENLFWDDVDEIWYDIDMLNGKRRKNFYASNFYPLWALAYDQDKKDYYAACAIKHLNEFGIGNYPGGIPASLMESELQWDLNVWPPLQHNIVSGLNKTDNAGAQSLAFKIATKYIMCVLASNISKNPDETLDFYEKYDPHTLGVAGIGGEYEVQTGFGWTNGVLIDFIIEYKEKHKHISMVWKVTRNQLLLSKIKENLRFEKIRKQELLRDTLTSQNLLSQNLWYFS